MTKAELSNQLQNIYNTPLKLLKQWKENIYSIDREALEKFVDMSTTAESFHIVGDYDVDGICSVYITYKALKEIFPDKKISVRFPKRLSEGYGINDNVKNEIINEHNTNTLIICVDNGIAASKVLNPLHDLGYKVCVLDHHNRTLDADLPTADFIIDSHAEALTNPLSGDYWCGAGVCYQLFKDLISESLGHELFFYTALATVADCMDMVEGNWAYVKKACENMRKGDMPDSMKTILTMLKQPYQQATEDTFGFYLGPCLNAPGRLLDDGAKKSFEYLLNPTKEKAEELVSLNNKRKALKEDAVNQAKVEIIDKNLQHNCPIWLYIPNLEEGLVGLVAGQIQSDFNIPTIVVTDHNGYLKGSGRGIEGYNLFEYLNNLPQEYFITWGGHESAAGLTITREGFEKFQSEAVKDFSAEKNDIEIAIEPYEIPTALTVINELRPFGQARKQPVFKMELNLKDNSVQASMVGQDKNHLSVRDIFDRYKIMSFFHTEYPLEDKDNFFAVGKISDSFFMGKLTAQLTADNCYDLFLDREKDKGKSSKGMKPKVIKVKEHDR